MTLFLANVLAFIGNGTALLSDDPIVNPDQFTWVNKIIDAIKVVLWPILILVAAAGSIYAVILGINMAKADSAEKREEAKKRLINVIIGVAITLALILFFLLVVPEILKAVLPSDVVPQT